jgi:regulator of sigma E protease
MEGLIMAAQLILGLSILVTLHELGHFWAARAFGIKVEKFYLFFDAWGFKLFSFRIGETEYGMGWLPFGGYVKIAGMIDESMDKEAMKLPPQSWEFRSKPAWQRLIVMLGGVTMNVLLGIALFSFSLYHYKKDYLANADVKQGIYAYDLGHAAGLNTGDKIVAINGKAFERFEDVLGPKVLFGARLTIDRAGKIIEVTIPSSFYKTVSKKGKGRFIGPDLVPCVVDSVVKGMAADSVGLKKGDLIVGFNKKPVENFGFFKENILLNSDKVAEISVLRGSDTLFLHPKITKEGTIGFVLKNKYPLKKYDLLSALKYGASDAILALVANAKGLGKLFTGEEKATDSVQGPIGIAKIYGGHWDWVKFWGITGLLSMVLAFMNILPIPALDGGHVIFLTIEAVSGRKFSDTFMERAQIVGMVILLSLMVFAVGNDIWKLFPGK